MNFRFKDGARTISRNEIASGRHLLLEKLEFLNDDGKLLEWEAAQRVGGRQAVSITALKSPCGNEPWKIVLVREYRAPVGRYCIGNPAGIIDENETPDEAAIRELKEETGYVGRVVFSGYATGSSEGLTGELVTPVVAVIDDCDENRGAAQDLDGAECIEVLEVPVSRLEQFLYDRHANGDCISGRLMHTVIGLKLNSLPLE